MNKVEKISKKVVLDKRIVDAAEKVFETLGIPFDMAINVYLYQVVYTQSIPFLIKLPDDFGCGTVEEYIEKMYKRIFGEVYNRDE